MKKKQHYLQINAEDKLYDDIRYDLEFSKKMDNAKFSSPTMALQENISNELTDPENY